MTELLVVLLFTAVAAGVLTLVAVWVEPPLRIIENGLTFISTSVILFAMVIICAEVLMRYGFNSPLLAGILPGLREAMSCSLSPWMSHLPSC